MQIELDPGQLFMAVACNKVQATLQRKVGRREKRYLAIREQLENEAKAFYMELARQLGLAEIPNGSGVQFSPDGSKGFLVLSQPPVYREKKLPAGPPSNGEDPARAAALKALAGAEKAKAESLEAAKASILEQERARLAAEVAEKTGLPELKVLANA